MADANSNRPTGNAPATRAEELTDFILDWSGATQVYDPPIIGKTPQGNAIALICNQHPGSEDANRLTKQALDQILFKAQEHHLQLPAEVWAAGTDVPPNSSLFRLAIIKI